MSEEKIQPQPIEFITKLPVEKWSQYRDLRLRALKNEPTALPISYDYEAALPETVWQERLANAQKPDTDEQLVFAKYGDQLVGMATVSREKPVKKHHVATISGIYLDKEHRGKGAGKQLVGAALQTAQATPGVEKVGLGVIEGQDAAAHIYESLGFKTIGVKKGELKVDGKYYDQRLMEKWVAPLPEATKTVVPIPTRTT